LRGEWDLVGGLVRVVPPDGVRKVTAHDWLIDTRTARFARALPEAGWYDDEHDERGDRWAWTRPDATVKLENPHPYPIVARVRLDCRAISEREVSLVDPTGHGTPARPVGAGRATIDLGTVTIAPGTSRWTMHSDRPSETVPGDSRPLNLCVYSLEFDVAP
jgi:hypothetical protein